MKRVIILFIFLFSVVAYSSGPTKTTNLIYTNVLGAGQSDTTVVTNIGFESDSLGIMLEINQDSVSGEIIYQYVTPNGYTNGAAFTSLPVLVLFSDNEKGVFSSGIPKVAGADFVQIYIITKNDKTSTQTIQTKVYSIKWR